MAEDKFSGAGGVPDDERFETPDLPAISDAPDPAAIDHLAVGLTSFTSSNAAEPRRELWRQEISALGGVSPMVHFVDSPRTRIDLTAAHPGGLPRFLSGQPTALAMLFREDFGLRNARLAASSLEAKSTELATTRGIDAMHLAVGMASWRFDGDDFCAPVLLRPLAIRRMGNDFELQLRGPARLNMQLADILEEQFHVALDPNAFVQLASENDTFTPQPVMDRLKGLLGHVENFTIETRLVASSFAEVKGPMRLDAAELAHPILDALAGNVNSRNDLIDGRVEVSLASQDARPPATDNLLIDADEAQERVVADIVAGNSFVVHALPGTGTSQTVINALGALVQENKRVLVVSPRRSRLNEIGYRLREVGLAGLAVSPRAMRRDVLAAITRNEKAERPDVTKIDDALLRMRKVLLDYRDALGRRDAVLGVSVLDALEQLSALALLPNPPKTTARLPRRAVEVLASKREEAAASLIQAAELGEFRYGPEDSPWYGVQFDSTEQATHAHSVAKRLQNSELPRLLERADEVIGQTAMRSYDSLAELGIYIRLLLDVRDTLDKFVPEVYDRSLTELIAATASRRSGDMRGGDRRRLRKLAQEYVRPGASVSDMHTSLTRIQNQRILWQRYVVSGAVPSVPVGISDLQSAYQRVHDDFAMLDSVLQASRPQADLSSLPMAALKTTLNGLAADSEVMANLQERTALMSELRDLNLSELLEDLANRHVPHDEVEHELELSWWQSVLEGILAEDQALLSANTSILDRIESDYRSVDAAHVQSNAPMLAARLAEVWKIALVDYPDEADRLRHALRRESMSARGFAKIAPNLMRALAPVWMCSPYEVSQLPGELSFDVVLLVDAGSTTTAENVGAIKRGKSVVAFGDPVTETPTPFDTSTAVLDKGGPEMKYSTGIIDPTALMSNKSVLHELGEIVPVVELTHSYRAGSEDLTNVINRRFYGERIEFLPWAGTFLGFQALKAHYLENAQGTPEPASGLVETTDAEVSKVVELVVNHAMNRPKESLMVITASMRHAHRVEVAIDEAFARRSDISGWLTRETGEPFTVLTLDQASAENRDRVIFSLGYGRTPHGRLLSEFGALSRFGGDRLLAVALTRARRSIDLITCFRPEEVEPGRLEYGAKALLEVLDTAGAVRDYADPQDAEPMLIDLAQRLRRRGLTVSLTHGGEIALAVAHGDKALAVESDAVLARGTLRESLRLRPQMLRRLGWHYLRVHSFELFADPESVAARIAAVVGKPDPVENLAHTLPLPGAGQAND